MSLKFTSNMSITSTSLSTQEFFQDFLGKFHSRKLLLHNPAFNQRPVITAAAPSHHPLHNSLHSNVIVVLSILVCGVLCSVGLNFLIRCTLMSCASFLYSDSGANSSISTVKSRGIKKKELKTFPVVNYSADLKLPGMDSDCVICLSEFAAGDRVRILPKCNHGFHVRCIDTWLRSNSSCPKCRHCLNETCQKIVGSGDQASSSSSVAWMPVQETVVSIRPLEPEGITSNC